MVLLVIFELGALDLVGEPFTVSALDQVLYIQKSPREPLKIVPVVVSQH